MRLFPTLKSRLLLLVLMAALPGLVLAVVSYVGERQRAIDDFEREVRLLVHEGMESYLHQTGMASADMSSPGNPVDFGIVTRAPDLPHGWVAVVLQGDGRILAYAPDGEQWTGRLFPDAGPSRQFMMSGGYMARGPDGVERWYSSAPLDEKNMWYFAVGGDKAALLASLDRKFAWRIAGLSLVLAISLAFGWFFVSEVFLRWARQVLSVSRRFGAGDYGSRIDYRGGVSELTEMSRTLDRLAEDIQQHETRRQADARYIRRLNRLYAVRSEVSRIIAQARGRDELFARVCELAVEVGGFRMAWVGLVDEAGREVVPVAQCCAGDYLDGIHVSVAAEPAGKGPTGTAVRENRLDVCNDIQADPRMAPWRDKAMRHDFRASVAIPLRLDGAPVGALSLYAAEPGFFDETEHKLLDEVGEDISLALAHFEQSRRQLAAEEKLAYLGQHDALTGLPNRSLAQDRLARDIVAARRQGRVVALLLIDVNRFKLVNDSLGHKLGDEVLLELSRRLVGRVREGDTVARLGGDEFAVILASVTDADDVALLASHLLESVRQGIAAGGQEISLTASMGISLFPKDGACAEDLLRNADAALFRAKAEGRGVLRYFDSAMDLLAARQMMLEAELRQALARGELALHYQPQVNLLSGRVCGMEALLRWDNATLGSVPPAEFIPVAEESGLILPIGTWVLRTACAQNKAWQDAGLPPLCVAVNFSAQQFRHPEALECVRGILRETGLPPRYLELELTESMLMEDVETAIRVMGELKALGVSLSLDDFGTGYSSMSYLSRFSFDTLKIDQSFVRDITSNPVNASIATTTIALARSLHLNVVAEGVESESQLNFLRRHQCDIIQGYFFSRPLPTDEFAALIASGKMLPEPAQSAKPTLLLVDDEPDILHALQRTLRRDGYRILTTTDAREGLEFMARYPVQVVVSDQRMPEMSGPEFLSRVKELHPEVVRIMLTGYSDLKSLTEGINRGAVWKFLQKPWEEHALRETLRDAFRMAENGKAG